MNFQGPHLQPTFRLAFNPLTLSRPVWCLPLPLCATQSSSSLKQTNRGLLWAPSKLSLGGFQIFYAYPTGNNGHLGYITILEQTSNLHDLRTNKVFHTARYHSHAVISKRAGSDLPNIWTSFEGSLSFHLLYDCRHLISTNLKITSFIVQPSAVFTTLYITELFL